MNAFKELGLEATATVDEVKARYRELALIHHPDHNGDPEVFRLLKEAYDQALGYASLPHACPACDGLGEVIHRKGFYTVRVLCGACHGEGSK